MPLDEGLGAIECFVAVSSTSTYYSSIPSSRDVGGVWARSAFGRPGSPHAYPRDTRGLC